MVQLNISRLARIGGEFWHGTTLFRLSSLLHWWTAQKIFVHLVTQGPDAEQNLLTSVFFLLASRRTPFSLPSSMRLLPPQLHASCKLDIALHGQMQGMTQHEMTIAKKRMKQRPILSRHATAKGVARQAALSKGVALQGDVATTLASIALHCATMVDAHSTETLPNWRLSSACFCPLFYSVHSFTYINVAGIFLRIWWGKNGNKKSEMKKTLSMGIV